MNDAMESANVPPVPQGFQLAGVHSGIKRSAHKLDLTLVRCDRPATAVGVYTQNLVQAAPVALDRQRTPSESMQVVVINSGNANACTGQQGMADARQMLQWAADACHVDESAALVMSTGIIGEPLPMDRISQGIQAAAGKLAATPQALHDAARGILTTDKGVKMASRTLKIDGQRAIVTGIAKGAGMIGPNMATMLGLIMTDISIDASSADAMFRRACDFSFNCTSVDGHMSTNDTALLIASGASGIRLGTAADAFEGALHDVCKDLAKAIADDGEGASHLIEILVQGCQNDADAKRIAQTIGNSPLVKTAVAGNDPNWGRIVSAAGYAGPMLDPERMTVRLNKVTIFSKGEPQAFDAAALSQSMAENRCTQLDLQFSDGEGQAIFWASDLTHEYVRMNAEYHT